ncbi:MAG: hypothetical protein HUU38_12115 [Anaerolineales bacterium]|nr:hypothetical protein [Anaerolineales bacterium]
MNFPDLFYYLLIFLTFLAMFAIFWLISGFIIFRVVDNKLRRCPNCKRGAAGIITNTETEPMGVQMDRTGKDLVRIKSEKVVDSYECKHCQHTWVRSFVRKERMAVGKAVNKVDR